MEIQTSLRQWWSCKAVCFLCMCTPPPHAECYRNCFIAWLLLLFVFTPNFSSALSFFLEETEFLSSETSKFQVWLAAKFCSRGTEVFHNRPLSSSPNAGPQQPRNAEESGSLRSRHCTEASPHHSCAASLPTRVRWKLAKGIEREIPFPRHHHLPQTEIATASSELLEERRNSLSIVAWIFFKLRGLEKQK